MTLLAFSSRMTLGNLHGMLPSMLFFDPRSCRTLSALLVGLTLTGLALGCKAPAKPTVQTAAQADDVDLESVWQASLDTLREYSFTPDRQDRREGLIRTYRETSKQFWEFWRKDSPYGYDLWDSSIHTTQRQVWVRVKNPAPFVYELSVEVKKYRWNFPERQVSGPHAAAAAFTDRLPTVGGEFVREAQVREQVEWLPKGRDGELERQILASILKKLPPGKRTNVVTGSDLQPETAPPPTSLPSTQPDITTQPSETQPAP